MSFIDFLAYVLPPLEDIYRKKKNKEKPSKGKKDKSFYIISYGLILLMFVAIFLFLFNKKENETKEKLEHISKLLEQDKKHFNIYPISIESLVRKNPLNKNILMDSWNNKIYYTQINNGFSYTLKSLGEDGILNTEDDISLNRNK